MPTRVLLSFQLLTDLADVASHVGKPTNATAARGSRVFRNFICTTIHVRRDAPGRAVTYKGATMKRARLLAVLVGVGFASAVHAEITIGFSISATGPAASLGIPERNTVALLPASIGAEKVRYIVLDDATDPTAAVKNARRFVNEDKVDLIIGSSTTPTSMAMIEVAAEGRTPLITMAPLAPMDAARLAWVFQTPQNVAIMASALADHMAASGVKSVGFIGYADAYGEVWLKAMTAALEKKSIRLAQVERYQRADTSVTGQVLKLVGANPDAVLIAGSGTPAVLPQATLIERGYKGVIYQTHGVANTDFLRVGGRNVEGTIFPVGGVLVAEQLPDSHPSRRPALDFVKAYEGAYGPGSRSTFGAHAYDAFLLLQDAARRALAKAGPGTAEFRQALRDALETTRELPASHGVFTMSPTDHNGLDERSRVMVRIENGAWKLMP
jgi:branched-chain amino acid transport system substrate-binding protein